MLRKEFVDAAMVTWPTFTSHIAEFSAAELDYALEREHQMERRATFLKRIIVRKCQLLKEAEFKKLCETYLHDS